MSISISKIVNFPQAALKFLVQDEIEEVPGRDFKTIGGVLSDTDYAWLSNGPRLEVVHTKTGCKVGAWTFGWVLKDTNTQVVSVDEIQRPHGKLPLLAVGVDCDFSGGMVCIFDLVTSKVIRAIQIKDKITKLHVVDAGHDVFTLPSPLRNFDGIIAVGTAGGDVYLIDICRQICDEALTTVGLSEIRDELNPCQLNNITFKDIPKIELHKEFAVRNSQHLAIHLNIVFDKSTKHFILKGPKGDDRIHVNQDEVTVSALYYCPQLGSLLVGYNFGALQLYNLMNLELVYTSPVCEEHIPISHFAVQEPADDPRAFCYVWAVYSSSEPYSSCLPLAVMYAFSYHTKEYHEGYGFLYQDFNTASVHYQMELGVPDQHKKNKRPKGGYCFKLSSITQGAVNKEGPHCDSSEDNFTLCVLVWSVLFSSKEIDTFVTIFDLNQWYKEQMPNVPNSQFSSTYMVQMMISNLINSATNKSLPILDTHIDKTSIQQYVGSQRLEEHFCPNSISFGLCCLRETDIVHLHNYGVQKALLAQIESAGPLCLLEPAEVYQEIVGLGLIPLFIDLPVNAPVTTNQQREIILGTALENQLMGWLCKCASEWANGGYLSAGCSLDLLISWAFQRAIALKTNCDNFCVPLFDYSEARLDNNTIILLNSCTRQIKNLCSLYAYVIRKLFMFVSNQELVEEQFKSLQMVTVYFEVLQWLLNVGLLPECPLTAYPRSDDLERISAPYPAEILIDFYNHRRGLMKIQNEKQFSSSDSVLFIDTLIEKECGGKALQEQWQNDGGNGLYPPPSLQALLRTYLIDDVELSYKHSVVIYVFLDLAMTLDQDVYKPVITHLIKFPAVFKLSPSLIKITQAFWQLDHGDYNTAMGLLLDPLVLNRDLCQWHHKIALRSLLLQKQHNFALLYVQVRKPVLSDDEDVLTGISLYVANNMLDEAFYFEKHFINHPKGEKFLMHLFKECEKNNKIRSIIYRSLSGVDEECFLKYLGSSENSVAKDLHVYYHLLRCHYIEAFAIHDRTVNNQIESQGLIGRNKAIARDKLVNCFKEMLPSVNQELLAMCQKEKSNIWQEVSKPTPMSVFIHNINENVQYKSTLIGAALAKAKQTFNETISDKYKIETEETPFFRTPTASTSTRTSTVVVSPKVVKSHKESEDTLSPPSAKRLKLSPRVKNVSLPASIPSKLETPIVTRKTSRVHTSTEEKAKVTTPHSILKVKSLINHTPKAKEFEDDLKEFEKLEYTPVTSKKSGLGLSPRKSLVRASPVVRFEGLKSSTSNSLNSSRSLSEKLSELSNINLSATNQNRLSGASSKNTSTEEETFYSPDTSLENEKSELTKSTSIRLHDENHQNKTNEAISPNKTEIKTVELIDQPENQVIASTISAEDQSTSPVFSPKGRRSYKRSLCSPTPIRSSPRLSKNTVSTNTLMSSPQKNLRNDIREETSLLNETSNNEIKEITSTPKKLNQSSNQEVQEIISSPQKSSLNTTSESMSSQSDSPKSSLLPKLRARKSLCRKVLETNTVNRMLNSPLDSPKSTRSKSILHQEITTTEESTETINIESTSKFTDGEESHSSSMFKKHNVTTSYVESDLDTSEDFSINYDAAEEPYSSITRLSNINRSKSLAKVDTKVDDDQKPENEKSPVFVEDVGDNNNAIENTANKSVANEISQENITKDDLQILVKNVDHDLTTEKSVAECGTLQNDKDEKSELDDTAASKRDQSAYSAFESTSDYSLFSNMSYKECGFKLSKSIQESINNRAPLFEEISKTQEKSDDDKEESMDVDNEDNNVIVCENLSDDKGSKDKSDNEENTELVYADLSCPSEDKEEENKKETNDENASEDNQNKDKKEETIDVASSINSPIDPEMNVFEISDDLSLNDGLIIEREVTLGENDLGYDQQNTLESVLEENVSTVTSTPINALEKNVLNEISSEDESNPEEEEEEDLEKEHSEANVDVSEKIEADEVIEINSSSDDNYGNKEESSDYSSESSERRGDSDEKLDVSYERNIYDSYDYSSESNCEDQSNEGSENNEDNFSQTKVEGQLFYGDILLEDDQEEDETVNKSGESEAKLEEPEEQEKPNQSRDEEKPESISEEIRDGDEIEEVPEQDTVCKDDVGDERKQPEEMPESSEVEKKQENPRIFSDEESFELQLEEDDDKIDETEKDTSECNETQNQCGLFYGDILLDDNGDNKNDTEMLEDKEEKAADIDEKLDTQKVDEENEPIASVSEKKDEETQDDRENFIEKNKEDDLSVNVPMSEEEHQTENVEKDKKQLSDPEEKVSTDKPTTENTEVEDHVTKPRKRSSSVSSPKSAKIGNKTRLSQDVKESLTPRRSTRRSGIVNVEAKDKSEKSLNPEDDASTSATPVRVLRPRRVSTEETVKKPIPTSRKRSVSVDEISSSKKQISKSEDEGKVENASDRKQRAASVSRLPKISEEIDVSDTENKRSKSVLENYSLSRRVTRRQMSLLKKAMSSPEVKKISLESLDPTVVLERLPVEGSLESEGKKVYETSPSSSNSTTSTSQKAGRRKLRSNSQVSEDRSQRSKSNSPVKLRSRKTSSDEHSNVSTLSNKSISKRASKESVADTETNVTIEPRLTRSRARSASVSSVNSEDSSPPETSKTERRKKRIISHSNLPEIKEEPNQSEKSVVPKKRTRQNSSQK